MATVTPADVEKLRKYVSGTPGDSYVAECAQEARDMVDLPISKLADPSKVPDSIRARAELECGAELFHRRQSRNGIAGLDSTEFAPMRIARDPMKAAMPYLQPYLGPAIG